MSHTADRPAEALSPTGAPSPVGAPIGIYLHVPFCAHICPYCDFNTYAGQDALIPRYVDAVEREIALQGEALGRPAAATVFFGGGTPSLLPPAEIGRLIRACRAAFDLAGDAEVTLEANPNGLSEECCAGLREAGVNRLSLGAQTLQRRGLRTLGRLHEADDTAAAVRAARAAGFDNLSLDLIFGWPGQTAAAWADDLARVLAGAVGGVPPDHLSLYSLIVEPGTPMHDAVARGILVVLDDDATADLYEAAIATLDAHGWRHYEIANWARRPGFEARHNLIYWRNGEWVGLGAGAHAQLGGRRTMNHLLPRTYIEAIERGELPRSNQETIAPATAVGETMMLGLRLLEEGVADAAFADRHRVTLEATFGSTIADLRELGLLDRLPDRIRLSHRGTLLANDVVARFLA